MWFHRCDQCRKRRLVSWYFEVYPPLHSKGKASGWWWMCADCLVNTISDRLTEQALALRHALDELRGERLDACWGDTVAELAAVLHETSRP